MNLETLIREVVPPLPQFGIDPAAEETRNSLLITSFQLKVATTAVEANSVGEAARDIRSFIAATRALGMSLRRPLKAAQERIKYIEDDYLKPLEAEQERLERVQGEFTKAERERVALEATARAEAIAALERDRLAAEQLGDPALAKAASEEWLKAVTVPLPEVHKVVGQTTRRVMCYEVTNIAKLAAARPELVKIEPKASAIRSVCVPRFLETSDERDDQTVPGLTLWWDDATSTRKW